VSGRNSDIHLRPNVRIGSKTDLAGRVCLGRFQFDSGRVAWSDAERLQALTVDRDEANGEDAWSAVLIPSPAPKFPQIKRRRKIAGSWYFCREVIDGKTTLFEPYERPRLPAGYKFDGPSRIEAVVSAGFTGVPGSAFCTEAVRFESRGRHRQI